MEITPQDLGENWRRKLLKRRALVRIHRGQTADTITSSSYTATDKKRRPRHARYWLRAANLPDNDAEQVATVLTTDNTGISFRRNLVQTFVPAFALWVLGMLLTGVLADFLNRHGDYDSYRDFDWIWKTFCGVYPALWIGYVTQITRQTPRRNLRRINTDAITAEEIEAFLPSARGELDRAYLNTVLDTIRQPIPASAGQDIRMALRAVGDAVSTLPAEALDADAVDAQTLRTRASEKRAMADRETDSLVQESLRRQAESEERQAHIAEDSGAATKRARMRYAEMRSQIDVLRSVLTVYASPEMAARMGQSAPLGDTVRRVAAEASAAALAKRELEHDELTTLYGKPLPEPVAQTVGVNTGGAPVSAPASSAWWRNNGGNGAAG